MVTSISNWHLCVIFLFAQAAGPRIGAETGKLPRRSAPRSAPQGFSANPGIGFLVYWKFHLVCRCANVLVWQYAGKVLQVCW